MTALALDGGAFEPPLRPPWLRPVVIGAVIVLHAAALSLVYLEPKRVEPPREVVVEIETQPVAEAAPPAELPAEAAPAPAAPPAEPAAPVAEEQPPLPPAIVEQPLPPVEAQPPLPPPEPPPAAQIMPQEAQPPLPPLEPPPRPAPVELAPPPPKAVEAPPPKPSAPRASPAKPRVEPETRRAPRPARSRRPAETPAESRSASARSASSSAAASAGSRSAYAGEVSSVIRGRLFYPSAARARGARGVVGVAFTIGPSGAVTGFSITRSAGDRDLDAAARSLVMGSRFPPPPGGPIHIATSFAYAPR